MLVNISKATFSIMKNLNQYLQYYKNIGLYQLILVSIFMNGKMHSNI